MDNDDTPIGRLLTRREALSVLGIAAAGVAGGAAYLRSHHPESRKGLPSCIARPEQTEGPYFVDERLNRSDIRSDPTSGAVSEGVPLALTFLISRVSHGECEPLPDAQVDVWHCDANGVYSDVVDRSFNTKGRKFLRGYQITNAGGQASFRTIYPGWYRGRTVHIHFKIRVPDTAGRLHEFTSQLYFDDALTDRVFSSESPYAGRGERSDRNADDFIFRRGGDQLLLAPTAVGDGVDAAFSLGFELD